MSPRTDKAHKFFKTLRQQMVQRLAYEKWKAKGCPNGTALRDWLEAEAEAGRGSEQDQIPVCIYRVKGRLLTGEEAAICTQVEGSCPFQVMQATTGGRHTALCTLPTGMFSEWQREVEDQVGSLLK